MTKITWTATVGINYQDKGVERRVEVGGVVPQALIASTRWLVEQGHVIGGWDASAIPVVEFPPINVPVTEAPHEVTTTVKEVPDGPVSR